jgi:hypothetical protein
MSAELFHVIATIVLRQTAHGPIPLAPRYDGHEREWTASMPYLFQRQIGEVRRVASPATVLNNLRKRCQVIGETNPAFRGLHFTPHDFRRLFATDLVNNGLPIHIGAALLGHLNIGTTQGYVAVFEEDVIRHVQDFLARRRAMRPQEEYRPVTEEEWQEFEEHPVDCTTSRSMTGLGACSGGMTWCGRGYAAGAGRRAAICPAVGAVVKGEKSDLPFVVVDGDGGRLESVVGYLRDLMLGDASPLTCRSYGFDLLRWHRLLWFLGIEWDQATEADVAFGGVAAGGPQSAAAQPSGFAAGGVGESQDG